MSNQITAFFKGRSGVAESVYQYDYGMVLNLQDIELPTYFDCYFEVYGSDDAIPAVGTLNRVAIPNRCLETEGIVTLTIPLHTGQNDSEVEYVVRFRVIGRARPVDDGSAEEQSAISKALAWLQNPVDNIEEIIKDSLDEYGDLSGHSHGEITNDGNINLTSAISPGDRLVIKDSSHSRLVTSDITFSNRQDRYLRNDGTWADPTLKTYTELFSGYASTFNTTSITLSDAVYEYESIEIYGEDGLFGVLPHGSSSVVIPTIKKDGGNLYAEWVSLTFGETTVSVSATRWTNAEGLPPSSAYAVITKIIGIK